jgi:hypothetical protein
LLCLYVLFSPCISLPTPIFVGFRNI